MPYTHTEAFRVRHYECDLYGHVNNAVYLRYLQETGLCAFSKAGLRPETSGRDELARMDAGHRH